MNLPTCLLAERPSALPVDPPLLPALPPHRYPHRQSVHDWLNALAGPEFLPDRLDDAARLRRLLPLVASLLDAEDRLALHQHLWALWARLDASTRTAAMGWLDGRFVCWCHQMAGDWRAPETWLALAEAHLDRTSVWPHAPGYVLALLRSHGQDGPDAWPQARWLTVRARLELDEADLPQAEADRLIVQTVASVEAGVASWAQGMARLFELAVRVGNEALAGEMLAQCVSGGGQGALSPHWFRRWLEGSSGEGPLTLNGSLQPAWLQPARLHEPAWRARLLASMHRVSSRARMQSLLAALGDGPCEPLPEDATWRVLGALESCYALADQRALPEAPARTLIDSGVLAPSARAALCRSLALQCLDRGDAASAARTLAEARSVDSDAQARQWLAALLRLLATPGHVLVARLAEVLEAGSSGGTDSPELALWQQLQADATTPEPLRTISQAMLARGWLDGAMEARATERQRNLSGAASLWRSLAQDPAHADEARHRLASEPLQHWLPLLVQAGGREHLSVAPPPAQANGELLIVLSCLESRHGYAQVRGLQQALPGHHLMFLNNPEFNWYSGEVFEQLVTLVQARVLPHFAPERVTCYFGSMGGHGALKLANRFGFRAVVFNAQVDLDLWATFRPNERQRLWAASALAHAEVVAGTAPLYLAVGSDVADREALSVLIDSLRVCRDGQFIIEKFADPHHAGLVRRIARHGIPAFIAQAAQRLAQLQVAPATPAGMVAVAEAQQASFWAQLDTEPALKVEIVWRGGRLFIAESTRCDTVST